MSKSAAGTTEAPGKNVRAKSGLNRAILDQGWFEFRRQLEYKLAWVGGWLVKVPPQNTSRTCPKCGLALQTITAKHRLRSGVWNAVLRKMPIMVGAINIKRAGHRPVRL